MVEERLPPGTVAGGLESVRVEIAGLRDDMREDLRDIKDEMTAVENRVVNRFTDYVSVHAADHVATREERDTAHARYDEYIRNAQLSQARRDGALGVARYVVELVSHHSGALVKILLALAGAGLVLSGRIDIVIS